MKMVHVVKRLAALVVVFTCGVTAAQPAVELKLSHYVPSVHGLHSDFLAPWAAELEKKSGGKVRVTIYPGGSSFGAMERQLDQVKAGVVDLALGLIGVPRDRLPRSELVELPFITSNRDAMTKGMWDVASRHLVKDYAGLKLISLHSDCQRIHTRSKVVRSLEDLKGLRLRTPSAMVAKMVSAVGAVPSTMPPGQVYENVEKGVIDGLVTTWDPMVSFRFVEVIGAHVEPAVQCGAWWFAMNERKYNALPPDIREAIDSISGDNLIPRFNGWYDSWTKVALNAVHAKKNTIQTLSAEDVAKWKAAAAPITEDRLIELEKAGISDIRLVYKDLVESVRRREVSR